MIVRFNQDVEIELLIKQDDENGIIEVFHKNDIAEFKVIGHPERFDGQKLVPDPSLVNVKFSDGSFAFGLSQEWFDEESPLFMEAEVRKGIECLDQFYPGWREKIDLQKLDLSSSKFCIVGQLVNHYPNMNLTLAQKKEFGFALGKVSSLRSRHFEKLTHTWKELLNDRSRSNRR